MLDYVFEVIIDFTIELEHEFSDTEIEEAGDIKTAIETLGEGLQLEITGYGLLPEDIALIEIPHRKSRNKKYAYRFRYSWCTGFYEFEVNLSDEELADGSLDKFEKYWKETFSLISNQYGYKVEYNIYGGILMEICEKDIKVTKLRTFRIDGLNLDKREIEFLLKVETEDNQLLGTFCACGDGIYYYRKGAHMLTPQENERTRETYDGYISFGTLMDLFEKLNEDGWNRNKHDIAVARKKKQITLQVIVNED